jgi:hypothetical protein
MSLVSEEINAVRAFPLPAGIWTDGSSIAAPRLTLVKWRSSHSDMLYQVYVNGRYAGTTIDSEQREILVSIPTSFESAVRIEVFAVSPQEAHIDFSQQVTTLANCGRVRIMLLRSQNLPAGATANIYYDSGTGQIDYEKPLNDSPVRIWPSWLDKAGFAMSRFGVSDFGWEGAAAVGFGKGSFGNGQFGLDADTIEWISKPLAMGTYKFGAKVTDQYGNESQACETDTVTVIPAAKPAKGLEIISFDKEANQLMLQVEN